MTVLSTQLQPGSDTFEANRAALQTVVDDLRATLAQTALGGSEAARSWRSRHWPHTACMAIRFPAPV
jgi:hypothetical protein